MQDMPEEAREARPIFTVRIAEHGRNEGYGFLASSCQKSRPHLSDAIADALMASDSTRKKTVLAAAIIALEESGIEVESKAGAANLNAALVKAARDLVDFWENWDAGVIPPPS